MLHVEIHRKIHRKFHYSEVDRYTVTTFITQDFYCD